MNKNFRVRRILLSLLSHIVVSESRWGLLKRNHIVCFRSIELKFGRRYRKANKKLSKGVPFKADQLFNLTQYYISMIPARTAVSKVFL